jgi:hypothetical protein
VKEKRREAARRSRARKNCYVRQLEVRGRCAGFGAGAGAVRVLCFAGQRLHGGGWRLALVHSAAPGAALSSPA